MTYASLMLNDQAMVLLRQYVQLQEDEEARLTHQIEDSGQGFGDPVYESMLAGRFARDVIDELAQEIQGLLRHPDLVPERHLEWHFVLNEDLVKQAQLLFNPSQSDLFEAVRNRAPGFVYEVAKAYKKAVAERIASARDVL